jgi:ElaB/YqjD/DUF883 family membrane-anchored ribosome-binding protein
MENQLNTLPVEKVDKTPEQIEAEMFQTREALTVKVAALENQVVGTVQNAANTLTDTVDAVKSFVNTAPETVSDTVEQVATAVSDRVKKTFDISSHVQSNPWTSMGMSVGLGFLAGLLVFRDQKSSAPSRFTPGEPLIPGSTGVPYTPATRTPGLFDDLIGMLGRKVKEATENVIDAATSAVNKNVREGIPKLVDEAAKRLVPEHEGATENHFDAGERIYGR